MSEEVSAAITEMTDAVQNVADQIEFSLRSVNVADSNGEIANVVDVLAAIASAGRRIGAAITPNIAGGKDANGGHVESLTEAVMGVTGGLHVVAEALQEIASAIRSHKD